jgi:GNAT superfamily N-acetyltransferase
MIVAEIFIAWDLYIIGCGMIEITRVEAGQLEREMEAFVEVLRDSVNGGASVGFLPPLGPEEARAYWREVSQSIRSRGRVLLAAWETGRLSGTVQLDLESRPNGWHRAEVMKLLVDSAERRRGIGRRLMQAAEQAARAHARSLLVLDTKQGDAAEHLYRAMGYVEAGVIPRYALDADRRPHATVFFYKEL